MVDIDAMSYDERKPLEIYKSFPNIKIINKGKNSKKIKNILLEVANNKNCYSSFNLAGPDLQKRKFITESNGYSTSDILDNGKGSVYISISRHFNKNMYRNLTKDKEHMAFWKGEVKKNEEAIKNFSIKTLSSENIKESFVFSSHLFGGEVYGIENNNVTILAEFYNRYPNSPIALFISNGNLYSINEFNIGNFKINFLKQDFK
tara:strand:- start:124 stop:735 length:612 start_codon:yes stop_codon:yes gene_type:complete